ncbi:MAG: DUF2130 domain-containing protein [Planctomycetaceae bacterium]
MSHTIACPCCRTEIEITEVLSAQLTGEIRAGLEASVSVEREQLRILGERLREKSEALSTSEQNLATQVQEKLDLERAALLERARSEATETVAVELQRRDQQLQETTARLKESRSKELELLKQSRELEDRAEQLELEVARKLDAERTRIRTDTMRIADEEHQLKQREYVEQIGGLRKQIDDLKRKAEQGSQQLQGEVQELALEELLCELFPSDSVSPVSKGVNGGDAHQDVFNISGHDCGRILWEFKRTKHWQKAWLAKARDDQRAARAAIAVIVTEVLPEGVRQFDMVEGVWVCNRACVGSLATAIRMGLIDIEKVRMAQEGQNEKMELAYSYLSGDEFRHRVSGIVESFVAMQSDLECERRSMQRIWSKREKQLQRALLNTAGLYGDLQGIVGASLPAIEGLSMPRLTEGSFEALEGFSIAAS